MRLLDDVALVLFDVDPASGVFRAKMIVTPHHGRSIIRVHDAVFIVLK